MSDKFKAVGSTVYIPGGGFDVRYCPEPKKLAERIARECNYHERLVEALRQVTATLAWQAHGECRTVVDGPIMPSCDAVEYACSLLTQLEAGKGGE